MHYIRIKQEYIDYLKEREGRIPNQDYGEDKYKPFYILDSLNGEDVLYVTQLTSPKPRHFHLKQKLDFKKIYAPSGRLLGATNLNYMFPVLPEYIEHLSFNDIKEIVKNESKVKNLVLEKKVLDNMNLTNDFKQLYRLKYEKPDTNISKRCLDFKQLEAYMLEFKLQEQFDRNDITVERSEDYSTFFIQTKNETYEYAETILHDMYGFLTDFSENLEFEQDTLEKQKGFSLEL